jgi:hypothetical protein
MRGSTKEFRLRSDTRADGAGGPVLSVDRVRLGYWGNRGFHLAPASRSRKKSLTFTTRPRGLMRTAGFMNKIGLLNKVPRSWRELVFPPVYPTKGS